MNTEKKVDTYFASPEKIFGEELDKQAKFVNAHPIVQGLLHSIGGLIAILNKHRQIIAITNPLLDVLGIDKPSDALGLRPGESLNCPHAFEEPGGCGTSKFCATCGAAIAIVTSLTQDEPVERLCSLTATKKGQPIDLVLLVRAQQINLSDTPYILLFLQDVTTEQNRAALERTFYHDVNNLLTSLLGASELLDLQSSSPMSQMVHQLCSRLKNEVRIQRILTDNSQDLTITRQLTSVTAVFNELKKTFAHHPASQKKIINFIPGEDNVLSIDISLLHRILSNMVLNGLEARDSSGQVKVWSEKKEDLTIFHVWNNKEIEDKFKHRIFRRNFSTKGGLGRGIGTYSMKLLGEKYLGGKVSFKTSQENGTIFSFQLPLFKNEEENILH